MMSRKEEGSRHVGRSSCGPDESLGLDGRHEHWCQERANRWHVESRFRYVVFGLPPYVDHCFPDVLD